MSMLNSVSGWESHIWENSRTAASTFNSCFKVGVILWLFKTTGSGLVSALISCGGDITGVGVVAFFCSDFGLVSEVTIGEEGFTVVESVVETDELTVTVVVPEVVVLSCKLEGEKGPELNVFEFCWAGTEVVGTDGADTGSSTFTSKSSFPEPKCFKRSSAKEVAISFCDRRACSSWSLTASSLAEGEFACGNVWW